MVAHMVRARRPLAEMILDVWSGGELPYRDMAKRARDRGHEISGSQLNNYANGHVANIPKPKLIRALAAALDRPYEEVRTAVLEEFLDYEPTSHDTASGGRRHVALPPDATDEERQEMQAMLDAWWEARRRREHGGR